MMILILDDGGSLGTLSQTDSAIDYYSTVVKTEEEMYHRTHCSSHSFLALPVKCGAVFAGIRID